MSLYDHPAKRKWRSNTWSVIADMIPKHPGQACGVYLIGDSIADLETARKLDFADYNIVGVDLDAKAVAKVRAAGGLAIQGDVGDIVRAWPLCLPLDFVFLDMQGGFSPKFRRTLHRVLASTRGNVGKTVLSVNLLRGRDDKTNVVVTGRPKRASDKKESEAYTQMLEKRRSFRLMSWLYGCIYDPGRNTKVSVNKIFDMATALQCFNQSYPSGTKRNMHYDSSTMYWPVMLEPDGLDDVSDKVKHKLRAMAAVRTTRVDTEFDVMCEQVFCEEVDKFDEAFGPKPPKVSLENIKRRLQKKGRSRGK